MYIYISKVQASFILPVHIQLRRSLPCLIITVYKIDFEHARSGEHLQPFMNNINNVTLIGHLTNAFDNHLTPTIHAPNHGYHCLHDHIVRPVLYELQRGFLLSSFLPSSFLKEAVKVSNFEQDCRPRL